MKTKLLYLVFCLFALVSSAQTISIVGTGVNGWPPDNVPEITLSTTDNVNYTIADLAVNTGEVKFRQDLSWTINWGGTTFPTGTATLGGPNIPTTAGTYTVNINIVTGAYSFVGSTAFPNIGIIGTALPNGDAGPDTDMATSDGIVYTLSAFTFSDGFAKFRQDDAGAVNWGAATFPSGLGVQDGPNIPVNAGTYTVTFNRTTGSYNFSYPSIGYLGTILGAGGFDGADVDMTTLDGILYNATGVLQVGEMKFRQDDSWTVNWGGSGLTGTASLNGTNIVVSEAGTYIMNFNRLTLEYAIDVSLGVDQNNVKAFHVYPNPARDSWQIIAENGIMESIQVFDISGKLVLSENPKAGQTVIDASALQSGIYFAKITSADTMQTVKLVKE